MDNNIKQWLKTQGFKEFELTDTLADASSREYFRIRDNNQSYIVMDSSKMLESLDDFVSMQQRLISSSVRVPKIVQSDMKMGYLVLEDFGSTHLWDIATKQDAKAYYQKAIDEICKIQHCSTDGLSLYDEEFLLFEMDLMKEWYLEKYLGITLTKSEQEILSKTLLAIASEVLSQPQGVVVHRDFHSKNLMIVDYNIGVIDFQDAKVGAITYDVVSLLRDLYIELDSEFVYKMLHYYKQKANLDVDDEMLVRWFDFMGLQRHIKVLGIFARLHLRDGKETYLNYLPQTLKYVLDIASKYEESRWLYKLLSKQY
jgi:aminoglycoside/choline kinase family phosphotransferase